MWVTNTNVASCWTSVLNLEAEGRAEVREVAALGELASAWNPEAVHGELH